MLSATPRYPLNMYTYICTRVHDCFYHVACVYGVEWEGEELILSPYHVSCCQQAVASVLVTSPSHQLNCLMQVHNALASPGQVSCVLMLPGSAALELAYEFPLRGRVTFLYMYVMVTILTVPCLNPACP